MRLNKLSSEETSVIRFFQYEDALTVEVVERNVGCDCGCATEAIETLAERGLIEIEDGWISLTDEGKWLVGDGEVATRGAVGGAD